MGVWSGRSSTIILLICATHRCASGQDSCPATPCVCHCNGNTEENLDLQERLTCLEDAVDQITTEREHVVRDCSDVTNNGSRIYQLFPKNSDPVDVLCVFDSDGKWTVLQQRVNGNVDFNRIWVEFQQGFGVMTDTGSFWLGLEKMHQITKQRQYTLRIDLKDWDDSMHHAEYSYFYIGDETSQYALALDSHSGTLPEALMELDGRPFSTFDNDNDSGPNNCAKHFRTAWWHTNCYAAQLNGPYRNAGDDARDDARGIIWKPYKGHYYSLKYSRMRIKPTFDN